MRSKLIPAVIIAAIPSIMVTLAHNSMNGTVSPDRELHAEEKAVAAVPPILAADTSKAGSNGTLPENDFGWLFQAVNKIVFLVLFGWAAGRVFMQFRRLIIVFIGVLIISNFALDQTGLVDFIIRYDQLEQIFNQIKAVVWGIGFVDFFAIIAGLWAGVSGFLVSHNGQQIIRPNREW
ncbi:MAG: hypothetical protein ACE5I1_15455 [bacterium]